MNSLSQITAELQGYDPNSITVAQAQAFLAQLVQPVAEVETVGVFDALGRTLAEDVVSPLDVPPHDNSAMDGYAFCSKELNNSEANGSVCLRVVGTALAGQAWRGSVGAGECLKIMTGAVMPPGLDTVIPQEFTQPVGDGAQPSVRFDATAVRAGDNRRLRGEDLSQGKAALKRGTAIGPAVLGLIASLGLPNVRVVRRLRVAYFSTGDEILSLGEPPREGAVYDSNRYTVYGLLTRLGCEVIDLGVVPDDPERLEAAFTQAAARADAIITSGGVSVGEADHTKALMRRLGDVAFWRIAMRPGRPMAVGRIHPAGAADRATLEEKPAHTPGQHSFFSYQNGSNPDAERTAVLFGLPGNPVAVMVTFLALVRPALLRMMGRNDTAPHMLQATSTQPIRKKPGRTEYQRGRVERAADGGLRVTPLPNQGSGVLSSMVDGNALIVLGHDQGAVGAGGTVDVWLLDGLV